MLTNFKYLEEKTLELYSLNELEYDNLYNISKLDLYTDGLNNPTKIFGFIRKKDYKAVIKFFNIENPLICSVNHLLVDNELNIVKVKDCSINQLLFNNNKIESIEITDIIQDFYDVSVYEEDSLIKTSDGIIHHNSHSVETTLNAMGLEDGETDGYFKLSGAASASEVYKTLYNNRTGIVLFDDCDSALSDQNARNLIKAATDTKKNRKMSYAKTASWLYNPANETVSADEDGIDKFPKYFNFEGRIIFISNLTLDQLDPDGAIRTRALMINVNPSDSELIDYMSDILDKIQLNDGLQLSHEDRLKALEIVKSSKRKEDISIRKLLRTMNFLASGLPDAEDLAKLYA